MFSSSRKQAQQIARQMVAGHCTLVAWWTLKHAGVLEAVLRAEKEGNGGLVAADHAASTNMSADVLEALLEYAAAGGLVVARKKGVHLTAEGRALLEHEDGVLELVRAYEPVLAMTEHLLAKLKGYSGGGVRSAGAAGSGTGAGGVARKSEYWAESQAQRYPEEVFPAVAELVGKHKMTHLLDIACGTGGLLLHTAAREKKVVGVGIGHDSILVRRANEAITAADLESRLIAVGAHPLDVCTDTQRTFSRIGVSRQLWQDVSCVIALNVFSEMTSEDNAGGVYARGLAELAGNFPKAHVMLIEPTRSERFNRNYYAAELALLLRLSRSTPWPVESWRQAIGAARMKVVEEVGLVTDGLTIFLCKAGQA